MEMRPPSGRAARLAGGRRCNRTLALPKAERGSPALLFGNTEVNAPGLSRN